MSKVIIIEDSGVMAEYCCGMLKKAGYQTVSTPSVKGARKLIERSVPEDIILADYELEDGNCIDVMDWMTIMGYDNPVVVMTAHNRLDYGATAISRGAQCCILKQLLDDKLIPAIKNAEDSVRRKTQLKDVWRRESPAFVQLYKTVSIVAPTNLSVLIMGESGCGKEHIARMIHDRSKRSSKPWVPVDCASFTDELAESAFFGHMKGAYTGATDNGIGYFEQANGGTLFMDEIGNLSVRSQQMLLRAIQEKTYRPVGSMEQRKFDIRFVFATNLDFSTALANGSLREDFYFRIKQYQIQIPPLRECKEDIMPLARYILKQGNALCEREVKGFDESAEQMLLDYWWPGNVRELDAVIKAAIPMCEGDFLTDNDLDIDDTIQWQKILGSNLKDARTEFERRHTLKVIKSVGGNAQRAYELLGVPKSTFYDLLKRLDIPRTVLK